MLFVDQLPGAYAPHDQRTDAGGDTTKTRQLSGGRAFRVVRNFPGRDGVTEALAGFATGIEYLEFPEECRWSVTCRVAKYRLYHIIEPDWLAYRLTRIALNLIGG